ncbi:MAG: TrkH family potassium uptake protein [Alphaproteobacteria bacterium]|nr:TrkH family potassium uptake protein [Alphaproteobacteria bacterium]
MPDLRPILFVVGILLATLAVGMCPPAIVDAINDHPDWRVFATAAALTMFVGVSLILTHATRDTRLTIRQAFILTTLSWVATAAFAALPFAFSDLQLSYADAYFEAMSGITTTGSTVIAGLEKAPEGILLWRGILSWFGGIGIIAVGVAILPMLQVGGMQLFRMESSDRSEKVLPRAQRIVSGIGVVYVGLSLACIALLWIVGLSPLDAIVHGMTAVATAGFTNHDASIGVYGDAETELILIVFMLAGALPFVVYIRMIGGRPSALFRDRQVRGYLGALALAVVVIALWRHWTSEDSLFTALRHAAFSLVSIVTTTGFVTVNYEIWGSFATTFFLIAMFVGGCSGSTSGGLKVYRFQILYTAAKTEVWRLLQPHGVRVPLYNGGPVDDAIVRSVLAYFFLYIIAFSAIAIVLALLGLDAITAISGAATAIGNVGPGLGDIIGPQGNFSTLPELAKWVLSAGMLLGRLEIFTVLVLLSRTFWRG